MPRLSHNVRLVGKPAVPRDDLAPPAILVVGFRPIGRGSGIAGSCAIGVFKAKIGGERPAVDIAAFDNRAAALVFLDLRVEHRTK